MSDAVQQIKDKLLIEDVVSSYVELHKAGKHFKGKSPFSPEKTPSFYVSPDRGVYYCFSTNQGGDMFTFIQAMEGVDFKGALKILAEKAGVELVAEDPKKRDERDTQYAVLEHATNYFVEQIDDDKEAKKYVTDRGVTEKTMQLWRIGLAPDEWRAGREHLLSKKYTDEQLRKAGLVKGDAGKDPYDVFRNRIMFPMNDASGRVVAFSGRTLSSDKDTPKYVNSPETELYKKSELLYGYDKARQGIRKFDFSLIVEGQFDVVLCHQAGYNNTIAVSGTALTHHHVQLLQRLSNRVVLALDADRAGLSAVKRAADVMLARGMDVKVARMPEGQDPADIIKEDPQKFKDIIGHSVTVVEHLMDVLKSEARDDRAYLLEVREEVLPRVVRIPSDLEQEHFAGVIAEYLGSTKDGVLAELNREREKQKTEDSPTGSHEASPAVPAAGNELQTSSRVTELVKYMVVLDSLLSSEESKIFRVQIEHITGKTIDELKDSVSPEDEGKYSFTIEQHFADLSPKLRLQEIADKLNELKKLASQRRLTNALLELKEVEQTGDAAAVEVTLKKIDELKKLKAEDRITEEIFASSA